MKARREPDTRTNEQFCQGLRNMGLTTADEAADRIERLEQRIAAMRRMVNGCPRDTNGDGDCGRRLCPFCGTTEGGGT